jgi:hypothetical protein
MLQNNHHLFRSKPAMCILIQNGHISLAHFINVRVLFGEPICKTSSGFFWGVEMIE